MLDAVCVRDCCTRKGCPKRCENVWVDEFTRFDVSENFGLSRDDGGVFVDVGLERFHFATPGFSMSVKSGYGFVGYIWK